jgi:hypothetical protein
MITNNSKFKTMKNTSSRIMATLFLGLAVLVSCSDDDGPEAPNEEEVITDVTYTFVNESNPNDEVVLEFVDDDGPDGPNVPVLTVTGFFTAGDTYLATVEIYNSIEDEDITEEVVEDEPDEHFFTYSFSGLQFDFARTDDDVERTDGNKLGFETRWGAIAAGTGSITVQLWHESETVDDSANGGLGAQTGGEDDFNITFNNVEIRD